MKDNLKIGLILLAGIFLSAFPYLPAHADRTTQSIQAVLRKKAATPPAGVPTPDVLWWKFDDGSPSTTLADSSGNGETGTTNADWNGVGVGSSDSIDNVAASSDYSITDTSLPFGAATIATFSFWLNPNDLSGTEFIIDSGTAGYGHDNGFMIYLIGSNIRVSLNDQQGTDHDQYWTYGGSAGSWSHHLFVMDRTEGSPGGPYNTVDYYCNGVSQGSGTTLINGDNPGAFTTTQVVNVGSRNSATSNVYDGKLDDLRIWTGDQSAYAVDIWRDSALTNIKTNLLAWYDFDGDGTDAHASYDLVAAGTGGSPDFSTTPGAVETDANNYLTTPAGLVHSSATFLPDTNADGSFVIGWRSRTAGNGSNAYNTPSLRNRMRYFTAGNTDYKIANSTAVNSGSGKTPNATDLVTAMTHTGSGDLSEMFTGGVSAGTTSATAYTGASGAGAIGSGSTFRFYFLGYWSRVLTDYEIQALTDVAITYADLP